MGKKIAPSVVAADAAAAAPKTKDERGERGKKRAKRRRKKKFGHRTPPKGEQRKVSVRALSSSAVTGQWCVKTVTWWWWRIEVRGCFSLFDWDTFQLLLGGLQFPNSFFVCSILWSFSAAVSILKTSLISIHCLPACLCCLNCASSFQSLLFKDYYA